MLYCPPNITLSQFWVNHGISHCLFDTVSCGTYTALLLIFGSAQWIIYNRYATPTDHYLRPRSTLFNIQIALGVLMLLLAIARVVLQATLIGSQTLYGYMIFVLVCSCVVWPSSIRLVYLERNEQLPSVPAQGHGLVLLAFWTCVFAAENLAFLNLRNEEWWFDLTSLTDQLEFALFVLRYVCACLLFTLGLKAPGISNMRDLINFGGQLRRQEELVEDEEEGGEQQSASQGSTWRGLVRKMRILLPFIWPKKSPLLQLAVIFCFTLLVIGRAANIFVPIYYKYIDDGLGSSRGPPSFVRGAVVVYVALKFLQGGGTGGMGLLNNLRSLVWIRQYTSREVQVGERGLKLSGSEM